MRDLSPAGGLGSDVLVDDSLNSAVCDQFFQSCVEGSIEFALLGEADGILFEGVSGVEDGETFVGSNECDGNLVVNDEAVNLACDQGSNGDFWSSTGDGGITMYYLYVNSGSVYPTFNLGRASGISVRCVLGS